MPVQIVGPSYSLKTRKADCQRSVNLFPAVMEEAGAKAPAILKPVPGRTLFCDISHGPIRGARANETRAFTVSGNKFYEVSALGVQTERGTIATASGPVEIVFNLNQVGLFDGIRGYYLDLDTNVFTEITAAGFYGTYRCAVIDGYAMAIRPGTGQFSISATDDFAAWDPLDFATAEGSPDNLVAVVASHREAWLLGGLTGEVWDDTGAADFPFERIGSAFIEHGCASPFSAQTLDNTVFWLGNDGVVWRAVGYTPQRISTHAIDEMIQSAADLSGAVAFTYQQDGHAFYCLNIPGLDTQLCYDVSSQSWHERAEFVDGVYVQSLTTCHMYVFGKHIVGCSDGTLCTLDTSKNTNNGAVLVRDRISPHEVNPGFSMIPYSSLWIDCNVGEGKSDGTAALLMMRYSNDGGIEWSNWRTVSLGTVGQRKARAIFRRLGESRDRVWHIRVTDDVPFTVVGALVR